MVCFNLQHSKHLTDEFRDLGQKPQLMARIHGLHLHPVLHQYLDYIHNTRLDNELYYLIHNTVKPVYEGILKHHYGNDGYFSVNRHVGIQDKVIFPFYYRFCCIYM